METHSDRKQVSRGEEEEGITKENEEIFRADGYACYFDHGDGVRRRRHVVQLTKFYTFSM